MNVKQPEVSQSPNKKYVWCGIDAKEFVPFNRTVCCWNGAGQYEIEIDEFDRQINTIHMLNSGVLGQPCHCSEPCHCEEERLQAIEFKKLLGESVKKALGID